MCEWVGVPDGGQRQKPQAPPTLILVPESKQVDLVCFSELRLFLGLRGKLLSKGKRPGLALATQQAASHPKVRQGRGGLGTGEESRKPQLRAAQLGDIPVAACLPTPQRYNKTQIKV